MAYTLVQQKTVAIGGTSTTLTPTSTLTAGNTIVLAIRYNAFASRAITSLKDQSNNTLTYSSVTVPAWNVNGSGDGWYLLYVSNIGASITSLTIATGLFDNGGDWFLGEYSGLSNSSPLVGSVASGLQSSPGTGADAVTSGATGTLSSQPAMVFGFTTNQSNNVLPTVGTGFGHYLAGTTGTAVEDKRVTSTAGVAATFTAVNGAAGYTTIVAAFAESGAAPATLSAPTPSGTLGTQTTATIGCTTTQNTGTFYCVVDSAANLSGVTVAQIKAGQKASGSAALAANNSAITTTTPSAGVTGLVASTLYSYAIVQNNANGDSNSVTGTFTTASATFAASINLVNSGGSAYATTSFNWFAMTTFGTTLVGNGTTSTNGSGVLAVSGITASGSGWLTGKDAATSLIVFGPTAVTFA